MALAVSTVFGAAKVAYAAGDTTTYENAVITKELKTVPGQALEEKFTFTFEAYNDANGVNPALDAMSVTINTADANAIYKFDSATAQVTYFANTPDLVAAIATKFESAKTGIYEYKVVETPGSTQKMTYDNNVYFLRVIKDNGKITVQVIKSNEDKTAPGDVKVNPTPEKDKKVTSKGNGSDTYKASDFVFQNSYKLDKNAVLDKQFTLVKNVSGLDAAGTKYTFTVKFVTPDAAQAANITAAPSEGVEGPVTNDGNGGFTVSLARDEFVTFSNIQEGTLYSVTETSTGQFTPSADILTGANTTNLPVQQSVIGVKGNADGYKVDYDSTFRTIVAGNTSNKLSITNTYDKVNPTGIIINNLPFILMVGIPVVAAAGYVVSRRKA